MSVWKNTTNNLLIFPFNTIVGQIPNTSLLLQIITKSLLFLYDNISTLTYFSGDGDQPIMMWSRLIVCPAVHIVLKCKKKGVSFHDAAQLEECRLEDSILNPSAFCAVLSHLIFELWHRCSKLCHHFKVFLISKMWDRLQSYMISLIFHIYKYLLRSLTVLYVSEEMYLLHCPNLSLPISSLQDFLPQPLTSCSHYGDMPQDSLFTLHTRQQWVRQVEKNKFCRSCVSHHEFQKLPLGFWAFITTRQLIKLGDRAIGSNVTKGPRTDLNLGPCNNLRLYWSPAQPR